MDPQGGKTASLKQSSPAPNSVAAPSRTKPQQRRPNYARIHSKPLPLEIYPIPAFIPQNPLSLLRIAYTLLQALWYTPSPEVYSGFFSAETSSVHVTDPRHMRALWEMGFFGKGSLSRSEPSWLDREKARIIAGPGGTSEEATSRRREERRLFKLERARAEREQIERQLQQELLKLENEKPSSQLSSSGTLSHVFPWIVVSEVVTESPPFTQIGQSKLSVASKPPREEFVSSSPAQVTTSTVHRQTSQMHDDTPKSQQQPIVDQEHLQLTPEESFFLSFGLGVLNVYASSMQPGHRLTSAEQMKAFLAHATYPLNLSTTQPSNIKADNQFLLNYVVYHHLRSLGWVIRSGSKFSVDYLLYVRGPVFSHAEFAVMIIPEHPPGQSRAQARRDWWWLHCINRVQTQVRKSLVLCYVKLPCDQRVQESLKHDTIDIAGLLRQYTVREFVLKRWSANRSRD